MSGFRLRRLTRERTGRTMSILEFALRLGAAFLCGALIGLERQLHQHTAGLRTGALVAAGAALFVLVAGLTPGDTDPLRIAPQIVTGVGFLCAGVIMRDGLHVRGLNTAGTLWCACGIGVLAGSGYYLPAFTGTIIVLAANLILRPLANYINLHTQEPAEASVHYELVIICQSQQENHLRSLLLQAIAGESLSLQALQSSKDAQDQTRVEVSAHLHCESRQDKLLEQVVARLSLEEGVGSVRWEVIQDEESEKVTFRTLLNKSGELPGIKNGPP
jgi:putative Mg2+ transporter-C (MgtC) family protein